MDRLQSVAAVVVLTVIASSLAVGAKGAPSPAAVTTPQPGILNVTTADLPKTSSVAVQIRKGTLSPGEATIWHTHPSPIFVYVESGTGTWEYRGARRSELRTAGQAIEEPAKDVTRIVNSATSRLDLVIFQVSKPGAPVLVPAPAAQ
jgi:quercetin dioxygenase-like cupin family protein